MSQFIPSLITPGKHFSVGVYKPQRGPAYVYATEGTVERRDDGSVLSFGYTMPGARNIRLPLAGRNTQRIRDEAAAKLMAELTERGWVAPDSTISL